MELPSASDLRLDATEAKRTGSPILVFFSSHDCSYCRTVRENYLKPMNSSGNYKDRLLFRVIHVEDGSALRDFSGKMTTHREFAARSSVRLTPQVRFLDHEGKELVPALIGLMTEDYYASILESAIEDAITKMRSRVALLAP